MTDRPQHFTADLIAPGVAYVYSGTNVFAIMDDRGADKPRPDHTLLLHATMVADDMNRRLRNARKEST